ncbi:MAG: acetylornithine deacetylase [Proteobacteria bacterium]|nr:acetylornithine deacetylase [Pseudomonadota bacterium]
MIARLVAFDTTSRNSNLDCVAFIRDYLAGFGVESELFPEPGGKKANLYATLGPGDRPGVALSGHLDVVPVDGQAWDGDPFRLVERDGRLYGRGAADMKGFVGAALALVPEFLARLRDVPLHLCLSFDEELGCRGVRHLISGIEGRPLKPRGCVVGEPTGMRAIAAHKGKVSMHCEVTGLECHSAVAHTGVNAVEYAALVIAHLKAMARRLGAEGPLDPEFDPPFTTAHTGVVAGGTALNIVPARASFDFEFRTLPAHDGDALVAELRSFAEGALLPEMRAVHPGAGFAWHELSRIPALAADEDDPFTRLVLDLAGTKRPGKVSFGTEAGLYQQAGIPAIVCGPGEIEQAHKPNEFIAREQIAACERFLLSLADRLAAL